LCCVTKLHKMVPRFVVQLWYLVCTATQRQLVLAEGRQLHPLSIPFCLPQSQHFRPLYSWLSLSNPHIVASRRTLSHLTLSVWLHDMKVNSVGKRVSDHRMIPLLLSLLSPTAVSFIFCHFPVRCTHYRVFLSCARTCDVA